MANAPRRILAARSKKRWSCAWLGDGEWRRELSRAKAAAAACSRVWWVTARVRRLAIYEPSSLRARGGVDEADTASARVRFDDEPR